MKKISTLFQTWLDNLDASFREKKPSDKFILFTLFPIVFGTVSYFFLIPENEKMYEKNEQQRSSLVKSIRSNQQYINSALSSNQKEMLQNEIQKATALIEKQFEIQEDTENKLINIMFRQKEWADLLEFLSEDAKNNKIKISKINTLKESESSSLDFQNVTISIVGQATFSNLMQYLNDIEMYGVFVHLEKVTITLDDLLNFELEINSRKMVL